jgi:hypothetical protein
MISLWVRASVLAPLFIPIALIAQAPVPNDDPPVWIDDDSTLVQQPSWISATVAKNIIVLTFRARTSVARIAAILRQVHGRALVNTHSYGDYGDYYVRVPSHPDACGVKQALDVLTKIPDVEHALPHLRWTMDGTGNMLPLPASHKGSKRPCPSGTSLLK